MLIVCPLRFEAKLLQRAWPRSNAAVPRITCSGPGATGIERWAATASLPEGSTVVLAGVAGSLCESLRAGEARIIDRVISIASDETWTPTLRRTNASTMTIVGAPSIIRAADERLALAQRTGAHLVDLESAAFARLASARGWRWGIVRGVSDDPATSMPDRLDRWIAPDGRTRTMAVLAALFKQPSLLRELRCLHHNSKAALEASAPLLAQLCAREMGRGAPVESSSRSAHKNI